MANLSTRRSTKRPPWRGSSDAELVTQTLEFAGNRATVSHMNTETIRRSAFALHAPARSELAEQLLPTLGSLSEPETVQRWLSAAEFQNFLDE